MTDTDRADALRNKLVSICHSWTAITEAKQFAREALALIDTPAPPQATVTVQEAARSEGFRAGIEAAAKYCEDDGGWLTRIGIPASLRAIAEQ